MTRNRILLVGGSGVFGQRLACGLAATTDAEVVIAGRSLARSEAAVRETGAASALTLDRSKASAADIAATGANLVIDAAGPFQGANVSLPRACIEAGVDYLDLADARDFVAAFPSLDQDARAKGVRAVAGASSTPALTHAALDAMTAGWRRIDAVRAGISAGNRAPRGRSLVEAILSWTGAPVRVFEGGHWTARPGWSGTFRHALPGLGKRRFALAETPDLDLLPSRFSPREHGVFTAGLELGVMHLSMSAIGALRRAGLLPNPRRLAGLLQSLASLLSPFGSDRGCMFVEACGRDAQDRPVRAEWTLVAPPVEGPFTPTLPALVLARALLEGRDIEPGARPCAGILSLKDLEPDFARHRLVTSLVTEPLIGAFEMALGEAFEKLPDAVRQTHRSGPMARLAGIASVEGATGLARLAALPFGLPGTSESTPVEVQKQTVAPGREIWRRTFGRSRFRSEVSYAGPGKVSERFGPFTFELTLEADAQRHTMRITGWRSGPLPMPAFLAPRSLATETESASGDFAFDVPIETIAGRLVHYQGELKVVGAPWPRTAT